MNDLQAKILRFVQKFGRRGRGYSTADIAFHISRQPGTKSEQQHSALVLRELRALERAGHVCRKDDKKPIVWCKV